MSANRVSTVGLLILVAIAMIACGVAASPPSPSVPLPAPSPGIWTRNAQPVDPHIVNLLAGPEACGHQQALLLVIGWPLGTKALRDTEAREYVRDVTSQLTSGIRGTFAPSVQLPGDASFTGYQLGLDQLWLSPATADRVAYLVRGSVIEGWPRVDPLYGCA